MAAEEEPDVSWAAVQRLCDDRQDARLNKDYARADRLRDELLEMGVTLHDDDKRWEHKGSGASGAFAPVDWTKVKTGPQGPKSVPRSAHHAKSEGDWECPKCKNVNWSHRIKCNRCQSLRPVVQESVSSYKDQKAIEAHLDREEMTACGLAFEKARESRLAQEEADAKALEERLKREEKERAAHPVPMVNAEPPAAAKKEIKVNPMVEVSITKPPEPKATGLTKLKRMREEMEKKKQADTAKRQKSADGGVARARAPVTLDSMCLDITEENQLELARNLRILVKVARAKRDQLKTLRKLHDFLASLVRLVATERPSKEVQQYAEAAVKIVVELIKPGEASPLSPPQQQQQQPQPNAEEADRGKREEQASCSKWLLADGRPVVDLAAPLLRCKADGVQISGLQLLPQICASSGNGMWGKKVRAELETSGAVAAVQQLKTTTPRPAVMDAVRTCIKELQVNGIDIR
ncbi:hypothetical protein DIPPA_01531 [Diplonema papillatum]|nr:hypothetical protein DIPPA_01531 [Diplonema papillatum]KAJ9470340.1 hypothetical protein DIPPA_01531 [Diplonema papillatum]